jgi:ATP-dependent exoDNAse (exonuclease V) alpha subunit
MALQRDTRALAADKSHGVDAARIDQASAAYTLKPEQGAALRHLTGAEGFAMLWGEAGTGKSHTLNATRAAYEAAGKDVIGLAWTNDVVQQMRGDGFGHAATIASELRALEKGSAQWTRNTVLVVDETAMVSTDALARVASAAKGAGAKLILAGDDKQLGSIERGGMFETLRQSHGAAILKDVQRVKDAEQQAAFNGMHEGEFLAALQTFDKAGGIHWTKRQSDTLREMAARYTADVAADPDKRRFMFAYTNKDVATLNTQARALHRARGDLGDDRSLPTKHGAGDFATREERGAHQWPRRHRQGD